MLTFTVYGIAQPKGSMRAFVPRGMKHPIVTDSNRAAKSWAQLVAHGATDALARVHPTQRLQAGPVRVKAAFYLPRPKKYLRRDDIAHVCAPDLDKLLRGIFDALTAVVWHDDSQVVEVLGLKRYAAVTDAPHVTITVEATTGTRPLAVPPVPLPLFEEA